MIDYKLIISLFFTFCIVITGCSGYGGSSGKQISFSELETSFDEQYLHTPIGLKGQVIDEAGRPLSGAMIRLIGWGDASLNNGRVASTDQDGWFSLPDLYRRSVLIRAEREGYYVEIVPVDLQRPLSETMVDAGKIVMTERKDGRVRMIFAGDVMFGRRYVDRDEDGVEGEIGDLIRPGSRLEDAKAITEYIRPILLVDDFTNVNLESPFITDTSTEHPYKTYTFFSYPETIGAIPYAGIESVSLGNNHVYDYLEEGMIKTLDTIRSSGLYWFGAGMSKTEALNNFLRININSVDISMQGYNGIRPIHFPEGTPNPWPDEYLYIALDAPIVKGGSLYLTESNITSFLATEAEGRFAVPIIHGGDEYGEYPTANIRSKIIHSINQGADLVIAHHPHTIYGIATYNSVYAFLSIGNLIFDQDVFETFQSYMVIVDVDQPSPGLQEIHRIRVVPFYLEGYVPKLVTGEWFARIGRHIGHLSTYLPPSADPSVAEDGLRGAIVFPYNNRVVVASDESEVRIEEAVEEVLLKVTGGATEPFMYQRTSPSDMLASIKTDTSSTCQVGRELMHYGDFEDLDIDDSFHEGSLWNLTDQRFVENSVVRSGIGAMVLLRDYKNITPVTTWLKNRVTFPEGARLTLKGYVKGDRAGEFRIRIRWYLRDSRDIISTTEVHIREGGTYDWEEFHIDLTPPQEAGTVRAYFDHYPPSDGMGRLFLDDIALILWEVQETADPSHPIELKTPNNWGWIRCYPADPAPQYLRLRITHRVYSLPEGRW
jgi:hypothetical protein